MTASAGVETRLIVSHDNGAEWAGIEGDNGNYPDGGDCNVVI